MRLRARWRGRSWRAGSSNRLRTTFLSVRYPHGCHWREMPRSRSNDGRPFPCASATIRPQNYFDHPGEGSASNNQCSQPALADRCFLHQPILSSKDRHGHSSATKSRVASHDHNIQLKLLNPSQSLRTRLEHACSMSEVEIATCSKLRR